MALNELTPILKELAQEPVAFCSGFISGILRLNLTDDPVKSWLENQAGFTPTTNEQPTTTDSAQRTLRDRQGPQSIDIE
jgi:hypothetical protein